MPHWYAIKTKPQHEFAASTNLTDRHIETFLPTYKSRRKWTDRVKVLDLPLFPTYVFAHFKADHRVHILRSPGVNSIVAFGNGPTPIPDHEILSLKTLVTSGKPFEPFPFLNTGQRIRVARGPLAGVEGIVLKKRDQWSVVVSVEILMRSVIATVDKEDIEPIK